MQAQDLAVLVGVDAGCQQGVDVDHLAAFADLQHQRVSGYPAIAASAVQGSLGFEFD